MKTFLKNFLTITLSILFTLGLLEFGIRYLNSYMGHYPQKDPLLHHSLVPRAKLHTVNNEFDVVYQINSYGLRDREYTLEKPQDVFRILMLGDSYTFGIGSDLDQTFAKILEKSLSAKAQNKKIEVINGGCSSYSPLLEYLFLIYKGLALQPDLVVLNYDMSDVQDDYKYGQVAVYDAESKPIKVPPVDVQYYYREIKKGYKSNFTFLDNSALYQFVMKRYYQLKGQKDAPLFYQQAQVVAGNIEYDRDLPMRENVDWKKHFENSAQNLLRIQALLNEKGISFAITAYPYGNMVNEREWKIGRKLRGFDEKTYSSKLFDYLQEFCDKAGVPFLNMLPDFQSAQDFPLYHPYDGHFTPAGNKVAAQALESFLIKQNLVPLH